jgi:hypothetical protein
MLRPALRTVALPVQGWRGCQGSLPQRLSALRQGDAFGRSIQPIGSHDLEARRGHMQEPPLQEVLDRKGEQFARPTALRIGVLVVRIPERDPLVVPGHYPGRTERAAP